MAARAHSSRGIVAAIVVLVIAALVVATQFQITTDISVFLPTGADRDRARLSRAVATGEASRTIIATLDAKDPDRVAEVSTRFEQELRSDDALMGELSFLEAGPPADIDTTLWQLYQPRRLAFAASSPTQAQELVSDEGLAAAVSDIHRRLQSPLSTLVSRAAPEDPFLSLPRFFEQMQAGRTDGMSTVDGRFVAQGRFAVVLLGTEASAFDAGSQRKVSEAIARAYERTRSELDVGPLETSGLGRFSIRAEETIKADIQRTTVLSIVGLFLLCLVVLRSFRLVLMTVIPIGSAVLVATAASVLIFGEVHGLTLAFGASLIGVCVDYVVHYYVHHAFHPEAKGPRATLARIWPALLLGATTTAVGFAVIAGSSFPGLRQVAVFATLGVTAALLSTRVLLPPLIGRVPPRAALRDRLAQLLLSSFEVLRAQRTLSWALLVASMAATAWGVLAVSWQDDLQEMGRLDPAMVEEDERVRARVARFDQGRFVIALGDTEEEALQVNDEVARVVAEASANGEIGSWHSIASVLPSARKQQDIDTTIRGAERLKPRLNAALAKAGFNEAMFAPFYEYLSSPAPDPLTYGDLIDSPAAPLVRSLRMEVDDRVGFVTLLRDVEDSAAVGQRITAIDGAAYVDQTALMGSAMQSYRRRTVQLLGLGLVAVMAILGWRYRSPRVVLSVMAPAVLAAGVTIAALAMTDRPLNLVGLTAILMILSIGVDYGVFLAETRREGAQGLSATLLGLMVCWASTVLGFGVLALSDHPTMNMIGVVAAVGVTASLLLAPTTLALLPKEPEG